MQETKNSLELRLAAWEFKSLRGTFYLDLAKAMKASPGEPITKFLNRYGERYEKEPIGILARHWLSRFNHVGTFTESVRGTIPDEDLTVLAVSEQSGDLRVGLASLGRNIIGLTACKKEIVGALKASVFLILLLHVFFAIEAFVVMPKIESAMKSNIDLNKLGTIGYVFFSGADFIRGWWWAWFALLIFLTAAVIWALPNYVGRMRSWLDNNILPFQMYRDFNGASFLTSLGSVTTLMGSQVVQLNDALSRIAEDAYPWLSWQINMIQDNLQINPNGKGEIFNTGIVNRMAYYRILDMADYAEMSVMLSSVGDIILETAPIETKKKAETLRYVLMIICLSMMLGVYGGTFGLIDAFKAQVQLKSM
ncbi:MAG: hypothetical protein Q7K26_01915 [bacterium]|nr:hypothetical protein [bacterium]